ncbi:MAG: sulfur carrier protein ThiS [Planctomycetes bacterium]|nr:sulfur carrier protein ThiS [Planctomycetota bacterium]
MHLIVNGKDLQPADVQTVEDLLRHLRVDAKFRAVAINRKVVDRNLFGQTLLCDGDRVEIVRPVSGGS